MKLLLLAALALAPAARSQELGAAFSGQSDLAAQNKAMLQLMESNRKRADAILDNCTSGGSKASLVVERVRVVDHSALYSSPTVRVRRGAVDEQGYKGYVPILDGYLIERHPWEEAAPERQAAILTALEQGLKVVSLKTCRYVEPPSR